MTTTAHGGEDVAAYSDRVRNQVRPVVEQALDIARSAGSDEQRCELAGLLAEVLREVRSDTVAVRDSAAERILRRSPLTHRPYEVARLMGISRAQMNALMRRWGL